MKKDIDIFIDVYSNEIINESFGTALKNAASSAINKASFGLLGQSKNKALSKNLKKTLEECQFNFGDGGNGEEDFSKASKVVGRGISEENFPTDDELKNYPLDDLKEYRYYKIIISNDYDDSGDVCKYGIKCYNVITGKQVKIKSNNFKLKTSWSPDEILKAINNVIAPLKITKDDSDLASYANIIKKAIEGKEKENADAEEQNAKNNPSEKLKTIKENIKKIEEYVENVSGTHDEDTLEDECYKFITELNDMMEESKPAFSAIKSKFNLLVEKYRKIKKAVQKKKANITKSSEKTNSEEAEKN